MNNLAGALVQILEAAQNLKNNQFCLLFLNELVLLQAGRSIDLVLIRLNLLNIMIL